MLKLFPKAIHDMVHAVYEFFLCSFFGHTRVKRERLRLASELFQHVRFLNIVQIANRYLFAHCGALRAFLRPYFLRSTMRESRVM